MTDKVELVNDYRSFDTETGENILSAALRQGIVIPHNCRNGFCGFGRKFARKLKWRLDEVDLETRPV